jgi:hypothetical protein
VRLLLCIVALVALLAAGCRSGTGAESAPEAPPATLPARALPDLTSRARTLDVSALAADALQPAALEALLRDAGYVMGSEREFSGKTRTFDHVVARTLGFADAAGADAYLDWLRRHGDDILGRAEPAGLSPPGGSGVVFRLARCGSCKKELPTFLAGWRRGDTVLTLLAAGSGADEARFSSLAGRLDSTASGVPG